MAKNKKYPIESTTPGFPELEEALFVAKDKIGWKSLTAFLAKWCKQHQPEDNSYDLKFWIDQQKPRRGRG